MGLNCIMKTKFFYQAQQNGPNPMNKPYWVELVFKPTMGF